MIAFFRDLLGEGVLMCLHGGCLCSFHKSDALNEVMRRDDGWVMWIFDVGARLPGWVWGVVVRVSVDCEREVRESKIRQAHRPSKAA